MMTGNKRLVLLKKILKKDLAKMSGHEEWPSDCPLELTVCSPDR